jgi:hypothetical protein
MADEMASSVLDDIYFGSPYEFNGNATEEIFRVAGLIENAEANLDKLLTNIDSCKSAFSFS